jgi:AraC-like DNA-binding protein
MPILLQHLFAIGGFQGILLFFLLSMGGNNTKANQVLGVWCLFLGFFFLGILINVQPELSLLTYLIGWNIFLPASFGALTYLYCRLAITDKGLVRSDFLHLLPVLLCYALNIDILFASAEAKFAWATGELSLGSNLQLSNWITYSQAFVYLGFSIRMVSRYQQQARNTLSDFNPEIFRWIWTLLVLTLLVWSFKVVSSADRLYFLSIASDVIIIFLIYGVALAQWRNPKLFTINNIENVEAKAVEENSDGEQHKGSLIDSGNLEKSTRESILNEVKLYMQDHHAYKDNQLNLLSLAELVGVSTHHLSEVLNQHEGKNFYHFVNGYRIQNVCEHLKEDNNAKIIELAFAAGFSSKSTFNAVFKQFTGFSPTQYRKNFTTMP